MGNQPCKDCTQQTIQSYAYGQHQVITEDGRAYAVIEKKVQHFENNINNGKSFKDQNIINKDIRTQKEHTNMQNNLIQQLTLRKNITNLHIAKLYKYQVKVQNYGYKVVMFYQYIPRTLRDRVMQIKQKGHIFTQRQLFSIIYAVESALFELQKNKIKHCCLNLDTILLKNNTYKLSDMSALTYVTSYNLVSRGNRQQFLSQSLLEKYMHGSLYPSYTLEDDTFSLGMILLVLGSGKNASQFYNWSENQKHVGCLNIRTVDQSLKIMQRRYSQKLMKKVKQLLYERQKDLQSVDKTVTGFNTKIYDIQDEVSKLITKRSTTLNSTLISKHQSRIEM